MFNPIIFLKVKILRLCKLNILTNYEMMLLALKSNTDPETLTRLADNKGWRIRSYVAYNPNTPTETLDLLANDGYGYAYVLWVVAQNPNTHPKSLRRLANDRRHSVRCEVAQNPNTSPETLEHMANDEDWIVRRNVAKNLNTPEYLKDYITAVEFMRICYGS